MKTSTYYTALPMRSVFPPGTANASSIAAQLESFVSTYGFKRIGFISPDGQAMATDGYVQDLSSRDFSKMVCRGLPGITNTLQDRMGTPEPINVFSIPVYDQSDSIIGVLFATYRNQHFEEILGVQSFNNQGFSCLVNQDGDLIATSSNAPASCRSRPYVRLSDSRMPVTTSPCRICIRCFRVLLPTVVISMEAVRSIITMRLQWTISAATDSGSP